MITSETLQKHIHEITEDILKHLGVEGIVTVEYENASYRCEIDSADSALLIGWRGGTLAALEYLVRLLVMHRLEEAEHTTIELHVDVGGYRKRQADELIEMARAAAQHVEQQHESQVLRPMNAYERRIVHVALSEIEGLQTESIGAEPNRRILIKPKQ
jgi:spoIIIJ-associated protein